MTDHHDFDDHDAYDDAPGFAEHDLPYADEPWPDESSGAFDLPPLDEPLPDPQPDPEPAAGVADDADPPAAADDDAVEVFPAALGIDLPEPVDGFPWIDTGSLGTVAAGPLDPAGDPVTAQDLAGYAATDLPPAADPWAALADSDDPATAALAKWWGQQ